MRISLGCIGFLSDLQKHVRLEYRKEPLSSSYHEGFEVAGQKGAILQHFSYAATSMPDCAANDGGYYVGLRELIRIDFENVLIKDAEVGDLAGGNHALIRIAP